jgi:hypothetical protein
MAGCAQVAEWLMAADCKSAAPWSYGGSNPPLCTMELENGFRTAIAGADVGSVGLACGLLRFGSQNHRSGKNPHGGISVVGLFRCADRADGARFALAWQKYFFRADVAQLVEHSLGKGEVTGSIPVISSRFLRRTRLLAVPRSPALRGLSTALDLPENLALYQGMALAVPYMTETTTGFSPWGTV